MVISWRHGREEVKLASKTFHDYISKKLLIELLDENCKTSSTYIYVVVNSRLIEPLIIDATNDELDIQVISLRMALGKSLSHFVI